jgi:hypothetical protein
MFTENKQAPNLAVTGSAFKQARRKENAGLQKEEVSAYRHRYKTGDKRG